MTEDISNLKDLKVTFSKSNLTLFTISLILSSSGLALLYKIPSPKIFTENV